MNSEREDRVILHCDCNSFFASVEMAHDPSLAEVPMAVCGSTEDRHGIVLAKNELAKRYGIQTAETVQSALRKCPGLVRVAPHHGEYVRYSRVINAIYTRFTDLCEPFGIDESWLDVTASRALFGDGPEIAQRIREAVRREVGITLSVGVSFNKTFAKMGSDYKKPDAVTVISRENYRELLYPLPVESFLFVGEKTATLLRTAGIRSIGDLANSSRAYLASRLGKVGEQLHDAANGRDDAPVLPPSEQEDAKSVGNGMTFRRDLHTREEVRLGLSILAEQIGERLRRRGMCCQTVALTVKDTNLVSVSRQRRLDFVTDSGREIAEAALSLADAMWQEGRPIRMLTVTAMNLTRGAGGEQVGMFDGERELRRRKTAKLENAVDRIRRRYGNTAIYSGAVVQNDLGIRVKRKEDPSPTDKKEPPKRGGKERE